MNNTQTSRQLDLSFSYPICGLDLERDESYATATDLGGIRVGLFFEPADSFCNQGGARVRVWYIADNTLEYFKITDILGLKVFWEALLDLTDVSTKQKAKSSFGEII